MKTVDTSRVSFISASGNYYNTLCKRVDAILNGNVARPYALHWKYIFSQYEKIGGGDVVGFAANYSFGWHIFNGMLEDDVSKQAMYLEVVEGILIYNIKK